MTVTNPETGTNVHEIAAGIFRISTPIPPSAMPGGFTFNQFLVVDEQPLLFHTGPRKMFPLVRQAVAHVLGEVGRLRYVGFSHVEADECGSLNEWLAAAPRAEAVCSVIGAMVSVNDLADRPPRALADGEALSLIEQPEHLERFVLGTCRHLALRARDADRRAEPTDIAALDLPAPVAEPAIDLPSLFGCLNHLDARARSVLHLSFYRDKSAEEIAGALGTTAGNVRVVRHRAVAQLRRCLEKAR